MRNLTLLAFICLAVFYVTRFAAEYNFFRPQPAVTVQDFSYTQLDGTAGKLSDHRGKTVVVHLWATWCPPCITELPALLDKAATRPDVDFLLVSVDKDQGRLRQFLQPYDKNLAASNIVNIHDPSAVIATEYMKVSGFPESFFLNSDLYQKRHIKGPVKWVSFNDF